MRTLYFKVFSRTECNYINPKRDRINLIAVKTDNVEILNGGEREIIERFVEIFKAYDPDRVIGFRQDSEDFPLLKERSRMYGIPLNFGKDGSEIEFSGKYFRGIILKETKIHGRENIDLFSIAWRDFPNLPTKDIDELAGAVGLKFKRVFQFKLKDLSQEDMEKYARDYISIVEKISSEILPFQESLSEITGVPLHRETRMTVGELIDVLVKREMEKRKIGKIRVGGKGRYEGGYVYLESPGVYENVVYLDFQSMYPSIIRVWNISPETVDVGEGEMVEVEGARHRVRRDLQGVIPHLIEDFLIRRQEIKKILRNKYSKKLDAEQRALKVMANAMYGYMGWNGATYYNRNAAQLIAALARYYIKEVKKRIEGMGGKVIYIDTDGIQFTGGDVDRILEDINSSLPLNLEFERIAERSVYWSKKKYAHLSSEKVYGVGLEYIRRDYPSIIKEAQRSVVEHLLKGEYDEARSIRNKYRRRIRDFDFEIEEIAIVEQMTKKPEEYEKATKASVAARLLMENFGIEAHRGMYIYIAIVRGAGGPTHRARPIEMVNPKDVDVNYYLKLYDETINRTFEPFGVSPIKQWF